MIKGCFVVLHYNTIEVTEQCIKSIQEMENQNEIAIVIVDNASSNGTGKILENKYSNCGKIKVLLRKYNDGFSSGNNAGCQFAIDEWNPEFLIVANNDIQFPQKDFLQKVDTEFKISRFDIAGPDIINPIKHIHQSPMAINPPNLKEVNRTILMNQCVLALFPFLYPAMKKYFFRLDNIDRSLCPKQYQVNVCLMGACLIFSRQYIKSRNKLFEPETKFYYEENIQTLWCQKNGKKIVYQPEIKVWHWERKATEALDNNMKNQILFRMENTLSAAKVYRNFLKELERK